SSSYTMTVDVTAVNDAPTITAVTTNDFTEDSTSAGDIVAVFNISDNETSVSNLSLTVSNTNYYTITNNNDGTATVTLTTAGANYVNSGNDLPSYTVTLTDESGATGSISHDPTVTNVNDAPTASNNTVTTNEDTDYTFTTDDFNYSDQDGDTLSSITVSALTTNGSGSFTLNGTAITGSTVVTKAQIDSGLLVFSPSLNDNGSSYNTFTFTVNDGTTNSSSYTITVDVDPVNDAPVADNETNTATEGTNLNARNGGSDDVLIGDTDIENDRLSVTQIRVGSTEGSGTSGRVGSFLSGTYGQLRIKANGSYRYVPNDILGASETGVDWFNYTVSDGNGGTDTATLKITVTGINDTPVAKNDNNTIDITSKNSLTVTNGSSKDVLGNDTDADRSASLSITEIRTGAIEASGNLGTIGQSLTGTYGSLILNSNGSYTYNVNSGLTETLNKGQKVFDYFNYTLSDGSATDYGTIIIKLQNGNAVSDLRDKKAERLIKREVKRTEVISLKEKNIKPKSIFDASRTNIEALKLENKSGLSEGLKLVDLVAENKTTETSGAPKDSLVLSFKVFNETNNDIVKYEGILPGGEELPDWIKIDPNTGETTADLPEGAKPIDFIIIATDQNNEKREISIRIDPEEIKKENNINNQNNTSINVTDSGDVNLIKKNNDGSIDKSSSKAVNLNDKLDIKTIIDTAESDFVYKLNSESNNDQFIVDIPEGLNNSIFNISKIALPDGGDAPTWVNYNALSGEITIDPPEGITSINLKLIIDDGSTISVKDLEISFERENVEEDNNSNQFIGFKDQLDNEAINWDDYGSKIINRL
ncbi:MAG: Ig-like domain-containing protein, partial [Alphaproteobacteria bacterium]